MTMMLRLLVGAIALFNIAIGVMFLATPATAAGGFFLTPVGSQGLATLRADFPGFFLTAGVFALIAAVRGQAQPLAVPLLLLAVALGGRCVSLLLDGIAPTAYPPMLAEAAMIAVLLLARTRFTR